MKISGMMLATLLTLMACGTAVALPPPDGGTPPFPMDDCGQVLVGIYNGIATATASAGTNEFCPLRVGQTYPMSVSVDASGAVQWAGYNCGTTIQVTNGNTCELTAICVFDDAYGRIDWKFTLRNLGNVPTMTGTLLSRGQGIYCPSADYSLSLTRQ